MKFFIPCTESDGQAEDVLKSICEFTKTRFPKERRIYSITHAYNKRRITTTVGKPIHDSFSERGHDVFAIIRDAGYFAVCLPNRCVLRGEPILIDYENVDVEYFDGQQDTTSPQPL